MLSLRLPPLKVKAVSLECADRKHDWNTQSNSAVVGIHVHDYGKFFQELLTQQVQFTLADSYFHRFCLTFYIQALLAFSWIS